MDVLRKGFSVLIIERKSVILSARPLPVEVTNDIILVKAP